MGTPYWKRTLSDWFEDLFAPSRRASSSIAVFAAASYGASFFLIAYESEEEVLRGINAFLMLPFWLVLGSGEGVLIWLANPAFWTAGVLVMRRRPRIGFAFATAAILLASKLLIGESDTLRSGYFLWLASMVVMLTSAVASWRETLVARRCS